MFFCLLYGLTLTGCANVAQSSAEQGRIAGFWQGNIRSGCEPLMEADPGRCNAVNRVTFAVEEQKGGIGGIYTCEFGNYVCRSMVETGNIVHGEISENLVAFRVFFPEDGSSCFYNGRLENGTIRGGFTCMQGGGIVDKGSWEIVKAR